VSATLEILEEPTVPKLYFWALQASFMDGNHKLGAGHLGLQWHPGHPGQTAVNWGGYRSGSTTELPGSESRLPSSRDNPNTRDFSWTPASAYRLHVERGLDGWAGSVSDLAAGETTEVRELSLGGDRLTEVIVWAEVFADCDAPATSARWSDLAVTDSAGETHLVDVVSLSYQTHKSGGCANTSTETDDVGVLQRTSTSRRHEAGTFLDLP
jgi:hypothetical protein